MSLGENSLVAAYQGKEQLKSRPSGIRVVTVLVLNSTTFSRLFFSTWPGSGTPLSRDLEGGYIYFYWL